METLRLLPPGGEARQAADVIAKAATATGRWLNEQVNPDWIFLSTPHGISLTNDFGIYLGSTANGTAELGADLHNSSAQSRTLKLPTILLDPKMSQQLVVDLAGLNVSGILVSADDFEPMPLHWAEVIPLSLLSQSTSGRRHLILSHPLRRYNEATDMIPELLELGRRLGQWFSARPERIAIVISADLSHTHQAEGPYGYSNTSSAMDEALGRWAADPCGRADELLVTAAKMQPTALSCGFTGLVLLHGVLCSIPNDEYPGRVLINRNATYYGMMVVQYEQKRLDWTAR